MMMMMRGRRRLSAAEAEQEEDPLIPLVHVFDHSTTTNNTSSLPYLLHSSTDDKENQCPHPNPTIHNSHLDIDTQIQHIENEIQRLSSRLRQLRSNKAQEEATAAKFMVPKHDTTIKDMNIEVARVRQRGLSLGPLDICTTTPAKPNLVKTKQQPRNNEPPPVLKPIKQSPAAAMPRRRGVSLGPLEIHHNLQRHKSDTPLVTTQSSLHGRMKSFSKKLNPIEEEEQASKQGTSRSFKTVATKSLGNPKSTEPMKKNKLPGAKEGAAKRDKMRSMSMSPRSRRHSLAKVCDLRGGIATVGAKKVVEREDRSSATLKPKGLLNDSKNAALGRRPSGSAKVRFVASRYSLTPASALGDELDGKRRKWSLPESAEGAVVSAGGSCGLEINAKVLDTSTDAHSPQSIIKVAELLPRIKTLPCASESPRDSGCAKRVADLVGRRSFFGMVARKDVISSYQARSLEDEAPAAPEAAETEAEMWV